MAHAWCLSHLSEQPCGGARCVIWSQRTEKPHAYRWGILEPSVPRSPRPHIPGMGGRDSPLWLSVPSNHVSGVTEPLPCDKQRCADLVLV
jgi:hypothetical protein